MLCERMNAIQIKSLLDNHAARNTMTRDVAFYLLINAPVPQSIRDEARKALETYDVSSKRQVFIVSSTEMIADQHAWELTAHLNGVNIEFVEFIDEVVEGNFMSYPKDAEGERFLVRLVVISMYLDAPQERFEGPMWWYVKSV